ncbi:MAG TPA: hypothetical protein VNL77_02385 [Roseiflexaceae bacterium]|nr:hypothetical protein [Roseiflexaceae bacterium]
MASQAANSLAAAPPPEPLWRHAAVFLGYLLLALVVTWPLALNLQGAVVQKGAIPVDAGQGVWNLWWARESLLRGWNPYLTEYVYFPQRVNLFYQTLSLPNALLVFPVLWAFGPVAAFNAVGLLSFALGGYLAYRLARGLAGPWAALAGGFVFAFSAFHMQVALGGPMEMTAIHWIPLYALVLMRALRHPSAARWLAAGSALTLATLASAYYGLFLAVFTAAHVLLAALTEPRRREDTRTRSSNVSQPEPARPSPARYSIERWHTLPARLRAFVLWYLRGLALLYAAWAGALLLFSGPLGNLEGSLMGDWRERQVFQAAALLDYLAPNPLHPLWGAQAAAWLAALSPAGVESGAALGYSVYLLAAVALVARWRVAWPWGALALLAFLLSLGPELKLAGAPTGVPLPYALLDLLAPFRNSTRPNYWIGVLMLPLSVLVALGYQTLSDMIERDFGSEGRRLSEPPREMTAGRRAAWTGLHPARVPRVVSAVVAALLLFELWPRPLPLLPLAVDPLYAGLGREAAPGAVLELPPRTNDSRAMLNQLCHGRPLAGGYLARTPDYPPINAASAMRRLWLAEPAQPDIFAHQPAAELATLGVRFVVLNLDAMSGSRAERLRALLAAPGIALAARTHTREMYAVHQEAARPVAVPGEGWHAPEAASGRVWRWMGAAAELRLLARTPSLVRVALDATAYERDRPLVLVLSGAALAEVRVPAAPGRRALRLHLLLPAGEHRLTLASAASPAPDGRRLSLAVSLLAVTGRALPPAAGQRVVAYPPVLAPGPAALCGT